MNIEDRCNKEAGARDTANMMASEQEKADGSPHIVDGLGICIRFQSGPISEANPVNGAQIEDVIQILIHRLEGFQAGAFACEENAEALKHLDEALAVLDRRTAQRKQQGVEGKNEVHKS